jgi:hypothetical protein
MADNEIEVTVKLRAHRLTGVFDQDWSEVQATVEQEIDEHMTGGMFSVNGEAYTVTGVGAK